MALLPLLVVAAVMRKRAVPRSVFSPLEINLMRGTLKIKDQNYGSFTIQK